MNTKIPPTVIDAPAPWTLLGRGYICMFRAPAALLDDERFVEPSLRGRRGSSRFCYMMFVDYSDSPVGPYHELLFIPGSYPFEDGKRHLSISRIFVSSLDSVVNGQRNWGIPKDVAQFDVRYGENGLDRVRVSRDGKYFAEMDFASWPISLPFTTAILPNSWITLGQHLDGQSFVYQPSAKGWVSPGSLRHSKFDPTVFPDLAQATSLLTVGVSKFNMTFHESTVRPISK